MIVNISAVAYLISGVCFIMALRGLSSPNSARLGNVFGIAGMLIAVITTLFNPGILSFELIIIGILIGAIIGTTIARKIEMTAMPQLVAAFHSLVGLAAVLVAAAALYSPESYGIGSSGSIKVSSLIEMAIGVAVGAITFTGSILAFTKLQGLVSGNPVIFFGQHWLNLFLGILIVLVSIYFVSYQEPLAFWILVVLSFTIGILLILPIGGADMPVVVSMLNSYSGWAAAGIGFTLENTALIITGALVGSSGAILSYIMCKAMNRSFFSVILGGFGGDATYTDQTGEKSVKPGSAEDAAFIMSNAGSVIIVPGYGLAVAQAQHVIKEMSDALKEAGVRVRYAIHPVAGRMPGHMNVLLAESNVDYDDVFELDEINSDFSNSDVAFVIGANDVTNPAAKNDPQSPIYGMPILDVEKSRTVLFVKRTLSPGYAGIDNSVFYRDNTMMLFGDAKEMVEKIVKSI